MDQTANKNFQEALWSRVVRKQFKKHVLQQKPATNHYEHEGYENNNM